MKNPSVNSIVERKWTPEQFWEYLEAFVGEWEADTIKDAMEGFGLTVASATIISELQAENGRLQFALMFWMPGVDLRLDEATREQCANDAGLLAGYSGPLAGRRWGNEIIDTVAGLQAMLEEARTEARLMRENWSEAEDRALAAESSLAELQAALYLEKNKSANLEQNYHEVSTRLEARVAELQATVKRLTANPADQRYWEGRYRDEATALSRIKEETIEECARVAETGIADMEAEHQGWRQAFGDRCAQPHEKEISVRREVASAIRSLGSTGGGWEAAG